MKIAIVTGAGSGIGRASALALMQSGWHVALAGRRQEKLEETAKLTDSALSLIIPTDVCQADSVAKLFDTVLSTWSRLDLLFNNAGTNAPAVPLEELTLEDWQRVVDVNLTALFLCTQHAFRIMKAQSPQGGRIINNGSISAYAPRPLSIAYTATKHAVSGLTKSTSLDGRRYNIACGQIDIGNAETELAAKIKEGVPQADGNVRPEPMMDVADVARAVAQMANLPLSANVLSMTIMANAMPYVGRG